MTKCLENFVSQTLGFITRFCAAELRKQKNDTIFYSDRWDDVILLDKKHIYKKVRWYDDRFYVKDNKTNRYYIRNNFIEVVIKDNATFVVYQSNKLFRVLKPLSCAQPK